MMTGRDRNSGKAAGSATCTPISIEKMAERKKNASDRTSSHFNIAGESTVQKLWWPIGETYEEVGFGAKKRRPGD